MVDIDYSLFVEPPEDVVPFEQCIWYHKMDLPGIGETPGLWDLRNGMDDYLGGVTIEGERVLEIGPASGHVTVELELRGADVVVAEVSNDQGWDFVPYSDLDMDAIRRERQVHIQDQKNTFWFVHRATNSRASAFYGDMENLPEGLGQFDTTFLLSVLLHCRNPIAILESAARRTRSRIVITDMHLEQMPPMPVMSLVPTADNEVWDTWWVFEPILFTQFLTIMGFDRFRVTHHSQPNSGVQNKFFTLVAERTTKD
jgi:SAM-dependent methyltransferase